MEYCKKDASNNNDIFLKSCIATLNDLTNIDNYLPVNTLYFCIFTKNNNDITLSIYDHVLSVYDLSIGNLYKYKEEIKWYLGNDIFLGYINSSYNVDYYYNLIKEKYNENNIIIKKNFFNKLTDLDKKILELNKEN